MRVFRAAATHLGRPTGATGRGTRRCKGSEQPFEAVDGRVGQSAHREGTAPTCMHVCMHGACLCMHARIERAPLPPACMYACTVHACACMHASRDSPLPPSSSDADAASSARHSKPPAEPLLLRFLPLPWLPPPPPPCSSSPTASASASASVAAAESDGGEGRGGASGEEPLAKAEPAVGVGGGVRRRRSVCTAERATCQARIPWGPGLVSMRWA